MGGSASPRGRFVAFEGGEACGKSTQARLLAEALGAVLTFEPGATAAGARIRSLVLDPATGDLDPRAETLLVAADRAQHVREVVAPALAAGRHVVTDRFAGSTVAYQGYGRGLDPGEVRAVCEWAAQGCWPDLVVLLDVPAEVASARLGADRDRMEAEPDEFHRRVREGFAAQAAEEPDRWAVVDGTGSVAEVAEGVRAAVRDRLGLAP